MTKNQNFFERMFSKSSPPEVSLIKNELEELKAKLEEASFDEYLLANSGPHQKDYDGIGSGSGGNATNYHAAIEQDLDIGTLQRLFVSEGWFYIVVFTIAKTIAALPIKLEAKKLVEELINPSKPEQGKVSKESWVDASGEPEQLIFKYPNDNQAAIEFYWLLLIDLLGTGNAYIYVDSGYEAIEVKRRTKALKALNKLRKQDQVYGTPVMKTQGLYRMNPSLVTPLGMNGQSSTQAAGYQFNGPDSIYQFSTEEVIHVRMPNPVDPFLGLAPIVPVYKNLLLDRYSTEHMIRFYKCGARLGGVIKSTKNLTKDQLTRLQRSFDQDYTGRQNHHRTLILPNGMDYTVIEQNPGETALIEFSKSNREPILSAYNVPPIKVGLLDGATFANAVVQQKVFFVDTIIPILTLLEQNMNRSDRLLPAHKNFRVKFDLSAVESLQENKLEMAQSAKAMLDSGFTVNEVRQDVWKKGPLKGGDKSPVIEKLDSSGAFPFFGASAEPGETKESEGATGLAHLSGPQVTSVMNICRRVTNGQLKSDAALVMLTSMFGIPDAKARDMLGMEKVEQKDDQPNTQPDAATIASDITPTKVTFEQRVAQLVEIAMANGYALDIALQNAIAQAKLEGFAPGEADANVSPQVQSDENNVTANEQALEGEPKSTEGESDGTDSDNGLDDELDKSAGEGSGYSGGHIHVFNGSDDKTKVDGKHCHVFVFPDGSRVETDLEEGSHSHPVPAGSPDEPSGAHTHKLIAGGVEYTIEESGAHTHEFGIDKTVFGGEHIHTITMQDGVVINSLTSADLRSAKEEANPEDAKSPEDTLKSDAYRGCPATKDQIIEHWKAMSEDGVKDLIESNNKYFAEMLGRMGKMFMDAWAKKLKKYSIHYKTKGGDEDVVDNQKIKKFVDAETDEMEKVLQSASKYGFEKQMVQFRLKYPDQRSADILKKIAAKKIEMITKTTRDQINKMVSRGQEEGQTVGQISETMRNHFDESVDFTARRLQTITRTETLSAISLGQDMKNQEFKKEFPNEKLKKVWITAQDDRVRGTPDGAYPEGEADHFSLEGEVVDEDDEFSNGLKYPRDLNGEASEVINCRCAWMTFHADDEEAIIENIEDEDSPMADVDEGPTSDEKGGPGSGGARDGAGRKPMAAPKGSLDSATIVSLDDRSPSFDYYNTRNVLIENGSLSDNTLPKYESWWKHRGADMASQSAQSIVSDFDAYAYDTNSSNKPVAPQPRPKPSASVQLSAPKPKWSLPPRQWKGLTQ